MASLNNNTAKLDMHIYVSLVLLIIQSQFYVSNKQYKAHNNSQTFPTEKWQEKSYGPHREKTCLQGFRQSEIQTSLLIYRG